MKTEEVYGLNREECLKLRGNLASQLRKMYTDAHLLNADTVGKLIMSIDAINGVIAKFGGRPGKTGDAE